MTKNIDSVHYCPKPDIGDPIATKRVLFLGMLFVSFLIVANMTAFKLVEFHFNGLTINFLPH